METVLPIYPDKYPGSYTLLRTHPDTLQQLLSIDHGNNKLRPPYGASRTVLNDTYRAVNLYEFSPTRMSVSECGDNVNRKFGLRSKKNE